MPGKRVDQLEELMRHFGEDKEGYKKLLFSVVLALSDWDFNEIYHHIKRTWDIREEVLLDDND